MAEKKLYVRLGVKGGRKTSDTLKNVGATGQKSLDRIKHSSDRASQGLTTLNTSSRALRGAVSSITGLAAAYLSLTAATSGFHALKNTALEFETIENMMSAASGSAALTSENWAFLRQETNRLGTSLEASAKPFAQLLTVSDKAGYALADTRDLFQGVSVASAAMGLSVDDQQGAFRALTQIMSKGKVQAEELRGQLGERIPGAFEIAADAMDVTTAKLDKMLEQGQVASNVFLPKFGKELEETFGTTAVKNADSARASLNRFSNAILEAQLKVKDGGLTEGLSESSKVLSDLVASPGFDSLASGLGSGLADSLTGAANAMSFAADNATLLGSTIAGITFSRVFGASLSQANSSLVGFAKNTAVATTFVAKMGGVSAVEKAKIIGFAAASNSAAVAMKGISVAGRGASIAFGALGGPVGVAATAFTAFILSAENTAQAVEMQISELEQLTVTANNTAKAFDTMSEAQVKHLRTNLRLEITETKKQLEELTDALGSVALPRADVGTTAMKNYATSLSDVVDEFKAGEISAVDFSDELERLGDNGGQFAQIQQYLLNASNNAADLTMGLKRAEKALDSLADAEDRASTPKAAEAPQQFSGTALREQMLDDLKTAKDWQSGIQRGALKIQEDLTDMASKSEGIVTGAFQNMEDSLVNFVKSGELNFQSFVDGIIEGMIRIMIQQQIMGPLAAMMGGATGSEAGGAVTAIAGLFHTGGLVGATPSQAKMVSPIAWDGASKFHTGTTAVGGLARDEVAAVLRKGEIVATKRQFEGISKIVNAKSSPIEAPNITVTVVNNGGEANVRTEKEQHGNGDFNFKVIIDQIKGDIAKDISQGSGPVPRSMQQTYGLKRAHGVMR